MPPNDALTRRSIIALVRTIVQASINEAQAAVRTPRILTGVVEDMDDDLDTVYIRMDQEAMSGDPTLSNNWDAPGVIAATRLGETVIGEQVRVSFDGSAGASAQNTSVPTRIVRPFGVETGQRMVFDGGLGTIEFWNDDNVLVGFLDATQWFLGVPGQALARIDPTGGLRLRDDDDVLRVQLSPYEGLTLRDAATGVSSAILRPDGLVVIDPASGDQISITSGNISSVPTPKWAGEATVLVGPFDFHGTPAVSSFGTGDDIDIRFVCVASPENEGAQTYTPPAGYTERSDVIGTGALSSLATSVATRDPALASPGAALFDNTHNNWWRHNGHSVIVRGGGPTSPSFRSISADPVVATSQSTVVLTINYPAGVVAGDLLLAFVVCAGPALPIAWSVPAGWVQLGVQVAGADNYFLSSGVWFKRAEAGEPTSAQVTINMSSPATTQFQATAVAIQNPKVYGAGLDIRRNNRSMPRGLVAEATPITASTTDWAYTSLPQTIITANDVPMSAGRKYRPRFYCTSIKLTMTDGNEGHFGLFIQRDGGAGFVDVLGLGQRQRYGSKPSAFTFDREPMSGDLDYVPTADETADWRVQLVHVGGVNYSVQLEASATGPIRFWFEDIGAVF